MLTNFRKKHDKIKTKNIKEKSEKINRFAQTYYLGNQKEWEYYLSKDKIYITKFDKNKIKIMYIATFVNNCVIGFKGKKKCKKDDIKKAEKEFFEWLNSPAKIDRHRPDIKMYNVIELVKKFDKYNHKKEFYCKQLKSKNNEFRVNTGITICPLKREEYNLVFTHDNIQFGYFSVKQPLIYRFLNMIRNYIKHLKIGRCVSLY
jgi:hypothetical protein